VPSRKQRRRREKTFRHEYEYVELDDAGNELEVDPTVLRKEKDGDRSKPKAKAPARGSGSRRPIREVPPPSWRRAVRRGGLMGAVLLVLMTTLFRAPIVIGIVYAAALIPFTYAVDRISYRTYLRRSSK
jgi:hypothetical protein